ncbi:hypothetical protein L208DRAFT_1230455 [Tricholoma matsutake]|nr:hypothetical protein L208DRAFT_1230455 [Tricholoma matsutake 945]
MSEDDRAARAARAKALFKKRQREKAGGVPAAASTSNVASPAIPPRPLSPVPSETVEEEKRDLGDVFAKDNSDTSWVASLSRVASPPPLITRVASPQASSGSSTHVALVVPSARSSFTSPPPETLQTLVATLQPENASLMSERLQALESLAEQLERLQVEKETSLQNERQTISLLVSEKSSLTAELERLEGVESEAHATKELLEEERQNSRTLDEHIHRLLEEAEDAAKRVQTSQTKQKELADRCREQERQLQLMTASMNNLKHETEQHQHRVRELEEQIQSDDRVERLEESLKNTQDRADELEFQLMCSLIRLITCFQAHTIMRAERDEIDSQRLVHSNNETELVARHSELQGVHATVLKQLAATVSEKDTLVIKNSEIQAQTASAIKLVTELQGKLAQAAADLAANNRQLYNAQNELKSAVRRAEDAEQTQKDLQAEGTNLMRSLDEMRSKFVELTGVRSEQGERIDSLEHAIRARETAIVQLEATLEEVRDQKEQAEKRSQEIVAQLEKDRMLAQSDSSELHKAFVELQNELDVATASLHNLEAQQSSHHQEAARRFEEIEHLNASSQAQSEELSALRRELNARRDAQDKEQDFLNFAQNEIESLRADLTTRDQEIEHLREAVSSFPNPDDDDVPRSLDAELLSSLRQQHALDLSAAQSQIRALENSVFDAEARSHALQKQVAALEDQLAHSRSRPSSRLGQRSFSPSQFRPTSRAGSHADLRRSSFGSHRPSKNNLAPPLSRSIFDQNMSAETKHKRLVSLSMLKARIDSEVEVTSRSRASSRASSVRALSPVPSLPGQESNPLPDSPQSHMHTHPMHRPQFLDDSHVFWCHACSGDLVIL